MEAYVTLFCIFGILRFPVSFLPASSSLELLHMSSSPAPDLLGERQQVAVRHESGPG